MNTVNTSTNFTGFPTTPGAFTARHSPLVPSKLAYNLQDLQLPRPKLSTDCWMTLPMRAYQLHAKIQQSHHARDARNPDPNYQINDMVMLSTTNRKMQVQRRRVTPGEPLTTKDHRSAARLTTMGQYLTARAHKRLEDVPEIIYYRHWSEFDQHSYILSIL